MALPRPFVPDTVFLLGSGVERDGWKPVIAAINEFRPKAGVDSGEDANYFFARHIYSRRFHWGPAKGHPGILIDAWDHQSKMLVREDRELKLLIAKHLRDATAAGKLKLRDEFVEFANKPEWGAKVVVTANWDKLAEMSYGLDARATLHIHGDIDNPSLLYLPTEIVGENYREKSEQDQMGQRISLMWTTIGAARRLVIAGCSVSALDAELAQIINVGLSCHTEHPCEVVIYDVGSELDRVTRRVQMFAEPECKMEYRQVDALKTRCRWRRGT